MASKVKLSNIYDLSLDDEIRSGDPILFTNPMIRKMLSMANVSRRDVIYDLGCGWAQNLIIALTEFKAKYGVGFEIDIDRHDMAEQRISDWNLSDKCKIIKSSFHDYLSDKLKDMKNLPRPTVIFYGLATTKPLLNRLKQKLQKGDRLVYYYRHLFPEIMPTRADFPFYVSEFPFKKTKSTYKWLQEIVQKEKSSIDSEEKPGERELWQELLHDYDVDGDVDEAESYRGRLSRVMK